MAQVTDDAFGTALTTTTTCSIDTAIHQHLQLIISASLIGHAHAWPEQLSFRACNVAARKSGFKNFYNTIRPDELDAPVRLLD